jgi:ubiquitin C-terminal hydrolase
VYMIGFANVGNTCGVNTLMQCFYAAQPIRDAVLSASFPPHTISHSLQDIFQKMSSATQGGTITPHLTISRLHADSGGLFAPQDQYDLCELLVWLVEKMHQDSATPLPPYQGSNSVLASAYAALTLHQEGKDSAIVRACQCLQAGRITCHACQHVSTLFEPMRVWTLDVSTVPIAVPTMIERYLAEERVEDWGCDTCHQKKGGTKYVSLFTVPAVLFVVLKRFQYVQGTMQKVHTPVHVPQRLHFHPGSVVTTTMLQSYNLCAVGLHFGSYHRGHYTSVVKRDDAWIHMDDASMQKIDDVQSFFMNNPYVYLLVYVRSQPPASR